MPGIAIILPHRETFSADSCGAIGLCVRDFSLHSRHRERITVFGGKPGGFEGIHYRALTRKRPFYRSRSRHYLRQLLAALAKDRPDWIEVQNRPPLALALSRIAPTILHLHNDPQEMQSARTVTARGKLLKRLKAVYCVSDYIRQRFLEGLEDGIDQVHVVSNGLKIPSVLPPKENILLFAGRLAQTKGALPLALALERALPKLPKWRAIVIGADRHSTDSVATDYEKSVLGIVNRLSADGLVECPGYLPHAETMTVFARAAIVVVPSEWEEPFGRTALEAMANGAALITSGRGGLVEVVGKAALIVPPEPAALTDAILRLANNDAERQRLAALGQARAALFSIERVTARLDSLREKS